MLFFKYKSKVKPFKQDIAPIGFYFDIFSTSLFQIPILPIPLRIDKVFHGQPTLFITPNQRKLERIFKKYGYFIDYSLFYKTGLQNLLKYAFSMQEEVSKKNLTVSDLLRKWWEASNEITTRNLDLDKSFTFITAEFIKTYSKINEIGLDPSINNKEYKIQLANYCDRIITYFRSKIEKNIFFVRKEDSFDLEKLYLERRKKYFPLEIPIVISDLKTNESRDMKFVPYLIYDDLLDCFSYNKKLLMNADIPINLKVYEDNKIINKTSTIDDIRTISSKIELKKLNLEELLEIS
jgi:L-rhamnose mutarotase